MLSVVVSVALALAFLGLLLVWSALRAHRTDPQRRAEAFSGTEAIALDTFVSRERGFEGTVRTRGELWGAESRTPVDSGQAVTIDGRRGLTLLVHANARATGRLAPETELLP